MIGSLVLYTSFALLTDRLEMLLRPLPLLLLLLPPSSPSPPPPYSSVLAAIFQVQSKLKVKCRACRIECTVLSVNETVLTECRLFISLSQALAQSSAVGELVRGNTTGAWQEARKVPSYVC